MLMIGFGVRGRVKDTMVLQPRHGALSLAAAIAAIMANSEDNEVAQ